MKFIKAIYKSNKENKRQLDVSDCINRILTISDGNLDDNVSNQLVRCDVHDGYEKTLDIYYEDQGETKILEAKEGQTISIKFDEFERTEEYTIKSSSGKEYKLDSEKE